MENKDNLKLFDLRYLKPNYNTLGSDYQVNIRPPFTYADFDVSKPMVTVPGIELKGFKLWLKNRVNDVSSFFGYHIKPTYEINLLTPGTTFTYKPFSYIDREGNELQPLSLYSFTYNPGYIFEDERKAAEAKGETPISSDWVRSVLLPEVLVYGKALHPTYIALFDEDENGNPGLGKDVYDNDESYRFTYLPDQYGNYESSNVDNSWLPTFEYKVGKSPYTAKASDFFMFSDETRDPNDPDIRKGEKRFLPDYEIENRKKRLDLAVKGAPAFYKDENGDVYKIVGRLSDRNESGITSAAKLLYEQNHTPIYTADRATGNENFSLLFGIANLTDTELRLNFLNMNLKISLPKDLEKMNKRVGLTVGLPVAVGIAPLIPQALAAVPSWVWGASWAYDAANFGKDLLTKGWGNMSPGEKLFGGLSVIPTLRGSRSMAAELFGPKMFNFTDNLLNKYYYGPYIASGFRNIENGYLFGKAPTRAFNRLYTKPSTYDMIMNRYADSYNKVSGPSWLKDIKASLDQFKYPDFRNFGFLHSYGLFPNYNEFTEEELSNRAYEWIRNAYNGFNTKAAAGLFK